MLTSTAEYVVGWASIIGADILIFVLTILKTYVAIRGPNFGGGNLSVLMLRDGKGDLLELPKFETHLVLRCYLLRVSWNTGQLYSLVLKAYPQHRDLPQPGELDHILRMSRSLRFSLRHSSTK